jgi:hypothetical protein
VIDQNVHGPIGLERRVPRDSQAAEHVVATREHQAAGVTRTGVDLDGTVDSR